MAVCTGTVNVHYYPSTYLRVSPLERLAVCVPRKNGHIPFHLMVCRNVVLVISPVLENSKRTLYPLLIYVNFYKEGLCTSY